MTQLRIAAFLGEGEQHLRRHLLPPRHGRSYPVSHRQDVFAYRGCHSRLQRRARRPDRQARPSARFLQYRPSVAGSTANQRSRQHSRLANHRHSRESSGTLPNCRLRRRTVRRRNDEQWMEQAKPIRRRSPAWLRPYPHKRNLIARQIERPLQNKAGVFSFGSGFELFGLAELLVEGCGGFGGSGVCGLVEVVGYLEDSGNFVRQ
jgi:hypothetical protein